MSRKNRDFFRDKLEFLRDRHLLLFIDIARRGLLIAYLALIVQGDNQTLKRLRSFEGYGRIIRFNRMVVILSTILGLYSLLICTILEDNLPTTTNHILFSTFLFLWLWLLWDFGVFIKVFYNIINVSSK